MLKYWGVHVLMILMISGCIETAEPPKSKPPSPAVAEAPHPDNDYIQDVLKREKLLTERQDHQAKTNKPVATPKTNFEFPTKESRNKLLDGIYDQLKQSESMNLPPLKSNGSDFLVPKIYFAFNETQIDPQYTDELIQLGELILPELEKRGDLYLQIEGHTDEWGSAEYNLAPWSSTSIECL